MKGNGASIPRLIFVTALRIFAVNQRQHFIRNSLYSSGGGLLGLRSSWTLALLVPLQLNDHTQHGKFKCLAGTALALTGLRQ
jgi:hypothetical protein